MTEYAHDPEFPYLAVFTEHTRIADEEGEKVFTAQPGELIGKFCNRSVVFDIFASLGWGYEVIDTTPKPKVPEGARFITWTKAGFSAPTRWYAEKTGEDEWTDDTGDTYTLSRLSDEIDDAEVTVLVPKEES